MLPCKEVDCCTSVNLPTIMDFLRGIFEKRLKTEKIKKILKEGSDTFIHFYDPEEPLEPSPGYAPEI